MIAIEESATVQPDGNLVLHHPDLKPGDSVKVILLLEVDRPPLKNQVPPNTGRRLTGNWGGGLADLANQFTSVELQHKASEWRGD